MKHYTKLLKIIGLCTLSAILAVGCTEAKAAETGGPTRSVQVENMQEKSEAITQHYIGIVNAKDQIEYSLKSSGRLGEIYVDNGDTVTKGQLIAKLDTKDLQYQSDAAIATKSTAQHAVTKAKESLDYNKKLLGNMQELYASGSISKDKLDQVELAEEVAQSTYDQALAQLNAAKADLNYKNGLLDDANIYAQADGTVIKVLYEQGELVPTGYPIIVQRSETQIVQVGIPQKNLDDIAVGSKAYIDVDDRKAQGTVTRIEEAPDTTTRTYMAEVTVTDEQYHLGAIAKVDIEVGQQSGIWVPIESLLSEGEDFVYVVEQDRAYKRTVIPQDTSGMLVLVTGLEPGDQVVTSGMKNLTDGIQVSIEN